jgi:hypothetical protein
VISSAQRPTCHFSIDVTLFLILVRILTIENSTNKHPPFQFLHPFKSKFSTPVTKLTNDEDVSALAYLTYLFDVIAVCSSEPQHAQGFRICIITQDQIFIYASLPRCLTTHHLGDRPRQRGHVTHKKANSSWVYLAIQFERPPDTNIEPLFRRTRNYCTVHYRTMHTINETRCFHRSNRCYDVQFLNSDESIV